jgi:uncharacterized protein (DUF2062 family)
MPRRFFRKFSLKRDHFRTRWWLAPFEHLLHDPRLWGMRRQTVVPGFALGLFVCYLPFPGHMVIAALLALLLRVNIPVAVIAVWVSNPLTMGPMFFFAFELGRFLLRLPPRPFEFELSIEWLTSGFLYIWQPLLLGSILLGAILSLVGFIALDLLWRASIAGYLARRRKRRRVPRKS